jgi:hypothetical protein
MYFTSNLTNNGIGACYYRRALAYASCRHKNLNYCYTDFLDVAHVYAEDCVEYARKMDDFFGMKKNIINAVDVNDEIKEIIPEGKKYIEEVIGDLRRFYFSTPKPAIDWIQEDDCIIHIRRGNLKPNFNRYIHDEQYESFLKSIKHRYNNIYIVSESDRGRVGYNGCIDFSYISNNIHMKLDLDICEAFHSMVVVDNLVPARSALSYSAELLSPNNIWRYFVGA